MCVCVCVCVCVYFQKPRVNKTVVSSFKIEYSGCPSIPNCVNGDLVLSRRGYNLMLVVPIQCTLLL